MSNFSSSTGMQADGQHRGGTASTTAGASTDTSPPRNNAGVRACLSCRQMKMKCEGSDNPPCIRCQKVGRQCLPQVSTRQKSGGRCQNGNSASGAESDYSFSSFPATPLLSEAPPGTPSVSNRKHHPSLNNFRFLPDPKPNISPRNSQNSISPVIPSIYSTPPVDAVLEPTFDGSASHDPDSAYSRKRKRDTRYSPSYETLTPATSCRYDEQNLVSKADMTDMIRLFNERHLPFIGAFLPRDFEDPVYLIENELPLVYCICYVTARYLPGGNEIRDRLLPEVVKVPKGVLAMQSGGSHADELSTLKSLFILYLYADLTPPSRSSNIAARSEIQFWYLKSVIEVYAIRLGLHRSLQDLRVELLSNPKCITETRIYQKYICWLSIFSSAHYTSIISATPPTLRIDSSIRAAPQLLQEIGGLTQAGHCALFGQIELNLIWEKASARHPRLGEWWSLPDVTESVDENSVEAVLRDTDREIDAWYGKWTHHMESSEQGSFLDFIARFTRFCISSYAVRFLRPSPDGHLTSLQKSQVRRCVASANHVLEWPLSQSPIKKDKLRYVDDTAFVMDSFCCLFIISVCQTFSSTVPEVLDALDNVIETTQLMVDLLGFDESHVVHVQGRFILKRAEVLRSVLERESERQKIVEGPGEFTTPESNGEAALENNENTAFFEGLDHMFSEEGFFGMEPIWDFSLLFPSV